MNEREVVFRLNKFRKDIKVHHKNCLLPNERQVLKYLTNNKKRFALIIREVLKTFAKNPKAEILDIGITYGFYDIILQEKGFKIWGTDLAERIPKYCRISKNAGIKIKPYNLLNYSFPYRKKFDMIIMAEVIEHLPISPQVVFEKIKPNIKRGGYLLITTPNINWIRNISTLIRGNNFLEPFDAKKKFKEKYDTRIHVREYSVDELEQALKVAGLYPMKTSMFDGNINHGLLGKFITRIFPKFKQFTLIKAKKNVSN